MDVLLIAGLWLDSSVWDNVAMSLRAHGHHPVPITLPGQGDGNTSATLQDQVDTVVAAVDAAAGKPVVVGHSAACGLAWLAADARPEKIGTIVLIGGFPKGDGEHYADFFPIEHGEMAFPGWGPFEGADSADLDEATKLSIASATIPVPEGVARGAVRLTDDRRHDVPVVVVCPEFTPEQARDSIENGEIPELARSKQLSMLDIDSGHWPMLSAPVALGRLLSGVAADA